MTVNKAVRYDKYRTAQKSLDTKGNMLNIECEVTFATPCTYTCPYNEPCTSFFLSSVILQF
jgi:hypothetical protein